MSKKRFTVWVIVLLTADVTFGMAHAPLIATNFEGQVVNTRRFPAKVPSAQARSTARAVIQERFQEFRPAGTISSSYMRMLA